MSASPLIIDTNLLLLFVVGAASRDYISKHKRLTEFVAEDYDALLQIIEKVPAVLVTPNTLTETSNLAAHISDPARTQIFEVMRQVISKSKELSVVSKTAAERPEFIRLGLTDSVLIEASSHEAVLITTDFNLYLAAEVSGKQVLNFNHIRDQYMGPANKR